MRESRRSMRLPGYDYTRPGAYFVTLIAEGRVCLFGNIEDDKMVLNEFGHIVHECWNKIPDHFPNAELDAFVMMPNHLHGILVLNGAGDHCSGDISVAATHGSPLRGPPKRSLGAIIAVFKSVAGRRINEIRKSPGVRVWQRSFHDRIIRRDAGLHRIRWYIEMNPVKWERDRENPFSKR